MATKILTPDEVKEAIYQDADFSNTEAERLSDVASSFLHTKTGYDFGADTEKEPLAIQAAILYVRQQYFGGKGYNKEHDYTLGLVSLIVDLQIIAAEKIAAAESEVVA